MKHKKVNESSITMCNYLETPCHFVDPEGYTLENAVRMVVGRDEVYPSLHNNLKSAPIEREYGILEHCRHTRGYKICGKVFKYAGRCIKYRRQRMHGIRSFTSLTIM